MDQSPKLETAPKADAGANPAERARRIPHIRCGARLMPILEFKATCRMKYQHADKFAAFIWKERTVKRAVDRKLPTKIKTGDLALWNFYAISGGYF